MVRIGSRLFQAFLFILLGIVFLVASGKLKFKSDPSMKRP